MAINQLPNLPDAPALGTPAPIFSSMMFSLYAGIKNLVPALNTVTEQIDQASANVNTKEASAVAAAAIAASARDEAVDAVAALPEGIINDTTISSTDTWSSSKISTQLDEKASLTGIETLTNKTIRAGVFTDGYTEEVFTIGGHVPTLSPTNGSIQTWTLTANSIPTFGTFNSGQSMTLMVDGGSSYTVTWPAITWKTNGGVAPILNTTGYTVIVLWKVGSVVYGARVGDA